MNALQFWLVVFSGILCAGSVAAAILTDKLRWITAAIILGIIFVMTMGSIFLDLNVRNPFVSTESPVRKTEVVVVEPTTAPKVIETEVPVETEAPAITEAPVQTEAPKAPVKTEAPVQTVAPTAESTATLPMPTAAPLPVQMGIYIPIDDEVHGRWANDVIMPVGLDVTSCYRSWQAVKPDRRGSKNTSWINLICDLKTTNQDTIIVLAEPIRYVITGKSEFSLVLTRDHGAITQLKTGKWSWDGKDPYDVSVVGDYSKQSKTLSVYVKGSGKIRLADSTWVDLSSQSFFQYPFLKEFKDGIVFDLDLGTGASVEIWIGSTEYTPGCGCDEIHSYIDLPILKAK